MQEPTFQITKRAIGSLRPYARNACNHYKKQIKQISRSIERFRFRVDQPLDRAASDFAESVQFNRRLLREAIGEASVYDADLSDAEYAAIQRVDWELLPRHCQTKLPQTWLAC